MELNVSPSCGPETTLGVDHARYEVALGLVLFAVDVACLLLVYSIARRIYPNDDPATRIGRLWLYVAGTTALGLIVYDRQDLVVGFVALVAVAGFARGWSIATYAVLAAGVAYKLVPLLLVPFWVLAFATMRAAPSTSARFATALVRESLIAGLFLALVPVLMYALCGGERAFVFLSFHSTRGLQLECSAAWPVLLADPSTVVGHGFGSHTLYGELSDRVARLTTPATMLAAVLSFLLAARGFRRAATHPRRPSPQRTRRASRCQLASRVDRVYPVYQGWFAAVSALDRAALAAGSVSRQGVALGRGRARGDGRDDVDIPVSVHSGARLADRR